MKKRRRGEAGLGREIRKDKKIREKTKKLRISRKRRNERSTIITRTEERAENYIRNLEDNNVNNEKKDKVFSEEKQENEENNRVNRKN